VTYPFLFHVVRGSYAEFPYFPFEGDFFLHGLLDDRRGLPLAPGPMTFWIAIGFFDRTFPIAGDFFGVFLLRRQAVIFPVSSLSSRAW